MTGANQFVGNWPGVTVEKKEGKLKGHKDVTIIEGNGRYRLSLCNFADKAAAYKKLNELKQNDAFKNAWILSSK